MLLKAITKYAAFYIFQPKGLFFFLMVLEGKKKKESHLYEKLTSPKGRFRLELKFLILDPQGDCKHYLRLPIMLRNHFAVCTRCPNPLERSN